MGMRYDWTAFVSYGDTGSGEVVAADSASSLDGAMSATHAHVADDIAETLSSAQQELKQVAGSYDKPTGDYRSRIEEALNEHEAAYAHHRAGIEYLRMMAAGDDAESVVYEDHSRWYTPDKVKELATTDTQSDRSVRQTVYLHETWQYHIHVDAAD